MAKTKAKVEFHSTPNPNAGKFVVDRQVVPTGGSRSYFDPDEAKGDPVGVALMALDGVRSVFMVDDFITVTKTPATAWDDLGPKVEAAIRESL
jgi:hypothetical protein